MNAKPVSSSLLGPIVLCIALPLSASHSSGVGVFSREAPASPPLLLLPSMAGYAVCPRPCLPQGWI